MQRHMVHHRAKRVLAVRRCSSQFYRLRDCCSQRTRMVRVGGDDILAGARTHRGRTRYSGAERAHNTAAVRFLLHGYLHLIHRALEAEGLRCITERSAPLTGSGLCGYVRHALLLAVVALRDGGVQLMGS